MWTRVVLALIASCSPPENQTTKFTQTQNLKLSIAMHESAHGYSSRYCVVSFVRVIIDEVASQKKKKRRML